MTTHKPLSKRIRYLGEAILAYGFYGLFYLMPMSVASAAGSFIARNIRYFLHINNTARSHIQKAMPELSPKETEKILKGMWSNLGAFAGEFAHIPSFAGKKMARHVTMENLDILLHAKETPRPIIFFSAHIANWEITARTVQEYGLSAITVYRPANNPWVNRLILFARRNSHGGMFPKGSIAARKIVNALKNNGAIAMLVDQKMNEGIPLNFFGRKAMTAPAMAEFAKKFNAQVLPVQIIRDKPAHYIVRFLPPMDIGQRTNEDIMQEVNNIIEDWIRQNPDQWFWMHRRWTKEESN